MIQSTLHWLRPCSRRFFSFGLIGNASNCSPDGFLDFDTCKFNETEGIPQDEKSDEVGDAQLRGLRNMIENIAQQRNAAATTDEDRVKVVMDGVNEKRRMYEIEELLARMNRYQDGTANVSCVGVDHVNRARESQNRCGHQR